MFSENRHHLCCYGENGKRGRGGKGRRQLASSLNRSNPAPGEKKDYATSVGAHTREKRGKEKKSALLPFLRV